MGTLAAIPRPHGAGDDGANGAAEEGAAVVAQPGLIGGRQVQRGVAALEIGTAEGSRLQSATAKRISDQGWQ